MAIRNIFNLQIQIQIDSMCGQTTLSNSILEAVITSNWVIYILVTLGYPGMETNVMSK